MWGKPKPMELKEGEPIHQMVARALLTGAIRVTGEYPSAAYRFVGPHGVSYTGEIGWLTFGPETVAARCEEIQRDFNLRMSAERIIMDEARRQTAITKPAFTSLLDDSH